MRVETSAGKDHHKAWTYLKRHSADWYEETKVSLSRFDKAACVIDLDGDDLFPRNQAGGGVAILSLGMAEETGEDMPEGYYANHDMVGKAPADLFSKAPRPGLRSANTLKRHGIYSSKQTLTVTRNGGDLSSRDRLHSKQGIPCTPKCGRVVGKKLGRRLSTSIANPKRGGSLERQPIEAFRACARSRNL